jgi:APA family basic amino acid/polyamine antiporter
LDPVSKAPTAAVALQSALAVVMVLTASFEALLVYIGFTLSLSAAMTVAGWIRIQRRGKPKGNRMLQMAAALVFVAGNLWIMFFSLYYRPAAAACGMLTIGTGLLVYFYFSWKERKRLCRSVSVRQAGY